MSGWLNATALAFMDLYDNLVADDKEGRLQLRHFAEALDCQASNPEFEFDFVDLCLWGWARCTISWLDDPDNEQKQVDMLQARQDFREVCRSAVKWAQ
jgi:hypothetical protein